MVFLIVWYLVLCFVAMPLDSFLSKQRQNGLPMPLATLLYLIGSMAFVSLSEPDATETHAAATAFRALPIEWQGIIGIIICAPVLWQAIGAYQDWKEN